MEKELEEEKKRAGEIQKEFNDFKVEAENQLEKEKKKNEDL